MLNMQNYLKILPRYLEIHRQDGVLSGNLRYCVEQYGIVTGPFDLYATFEGNVENSSPLEIVFKSRPKHQELFEYFFSHMKTYMPKYNGNCPLKDIYLKKLNFFEYYFL